MKLKVAQSCLTLCDPMDYTVYGILQARILEWLAVLFSRGYSQPRDRIQVFCIAGRKRREAKSKGEKKRYKHLNAEFQRIARRDKKAFFSDQCKEIEENNRMGKIDTSSRKSEIPKEHFMQRWAR